MEEEKTSEQGDVELCSNAGYSYDRPRSVASSGSTTSTLRELRRSAVAAHKGRRFKVAALLGVVFLVAIVLAIAIATSGAEDSITMNSSVGIDSSTENTEQPELQDGIPVDSPQEEGEDYPSGHMYDEAPDSTIVESVSTSSPSKMPSAAVVTTALDNAEANLDAETQGSSDPEDTTDVDDFFIILGGDGSGDGIDDDDVFEILDADGDGSFIDDIADFTCNIFAIFCN